MSHFLRIFGTLSLLGILAANVRPANAAQIQLNANAPSLCAVVQGSNTAAGTAVIAYSCSGGPNDRWNYINGQFQGLGTYNGASTCLDVKGQGTASGTLVDLWPCNGQQNQQWLIQSGSIMGDRSSQEDPYSPLTIALRHSSEM
jgi:Ricin-type beta-trefoil lectin domain